MRGSTKIGRVLLHAIGFIGLGTMGGPMARNLLKAGFALRIFDVNPAALKGLSATGAFAADSAADAARGADVVITMLPNGEHVETAVFGKSGAVETMERGTLFVDMSTIAPTVTDRIAAKLAERAIAMLDAPVGRSSQHAIDGKLLIMVGGAAVDLERARPLFEKLGDTIVHCGAVGSGGRMKLVNNFMSVTLNATTAEALILAEASGLGSQGDARHCCGPRPHGYDLSGQGAQGRSHAGVHGRSGAQGLGSGDRACLAAGRRSAYCIGGEGSLRFRPRARLWPQGLDSDLHGFEQPSPRRLPQIVSSSMSALKGGKRTRGISPPRERAPAAEASGATKQGRVGHLH
jgi:6-phosphogluconate dehydrogenase (decarboxylating)